jgi:HEAT repeat protein
LGGGAGAIDPERTVLALLERLQREKEPLVRTAIIYSLGRLGSNAKSALPELRQATNDSDASVAEQAAKSINAIESNTP